MTCMSRPRMDALTFPIMEAQREARERMNKRWREQSKHGSQPNPHQSPRSPPPPPPPPPPGRRDYYQILRVSRDASATEVKRAYHAMAKRWHPDKNLEGERAAKAERNFRLIARAHEVLSDRNLRARYDRGEDVDRR